MASTIVLPTATIAVLTRFASEQRARCLNWLHSQMNLRRHDAEDVFQDAFVTLYEQLTNGTLTELPRSLSSYFNVICLHKAQERLRDNGKHAGLIADRLTQDDKEENFIARNEQEEPDFDEELIDEVLSMDDGLGTSLSAEDEESESIDDNARVRAEAVERKEAAVREVVRELPDPCNKLLWGFYFDGFTMKQLAEMYGYKTPESAKVMKCKCMNKFEARMRELYRNMFNQ